MMRFVGAVLVVVAALHVPASAGVRDNFNAGVAAYNLGNFDEAITFLTHAIDSGELPERNLTVGHHKRGLAYANKGQYDRAIADFDKAIGLKPDHVYAYYGRGFVYLKQGRYDRAIADYGKVIALKPDSADTYTNRGIAYANKSQYDRAIADFDKAITLEPDYAFRAYYNRGAAYWSKGKYERAIADYDKAIALNSNSADAYLERGFLHFIQGRFFFGFSDMERAVTRGLLDHYTVMWLYVARAHAGQGGDEQLAAFAEKLDLAEWPGPAVEMFLGQATAEQVLAAANDPDPERQRQMRCDAFFFVGEHYLLKAVQNRAIDYLRRALAVCPKDLMQFEGAKAQLERLGAAP